MKKFWILFLVAAATMFSGVDASARTVKGKVVCGKQGLSEVIVTDGYEFTKTKKNGEFQMELADSARFVYIVTPSGYAADWSTGAPQFYQKIDDRESYTFDLIKTGDPSSRYNLVTVSDPQPSHEGHCDEFDGAPLEDICQTVKELDGLTVGLVMGDVCFNVYPLMGRWKKSIVRAGIPFYVVPGNHDHVYEILTDRQSTEIYTEYFGPENYALFIGKDVVIMLDNIIYGFTRGSDHYNEGYSDYVLAWLKKLMQHIPSDAHVYVGQHSPTNGRAVLHGRKPTDFIINGNEFLKTLEGHKVTIISGHNHINMNFRYSPDIVEHNVAAVCGTWWDAYYCKDGTPRGYKVYTSQDGNLRWYYKSVGKDKDYQYEIFRPGEGRLNPESVVVNLWDYDENWTLEWFEDGKPNGAMRKVEEYSPSHQAEVEATAAMRNQPVEEWKLPIRSSHCFAATPSAGARKITIIIRNPFGKEWKEDVYLWENEARAAEIVAQMTLEEKVNYVGGYENWYVRAIERLGLPEVRMADGPQGVRNNTKSTLYPSGIAAAATWDRTLIRQMGIALGQDSRARGVHILLGPGANIYRSPLCGRNFEYFGEDPYLAGEIAANYILGVQSQGVMTSIKHFAANNQEWARHSVSSDIDERTLHEIYFPAFEKAVKTADVATVMTSYNLLNSVHASESKYLNYDVLRDMWGFKGFVMSDWTSCYSPLNVATWGVDLEMPAPLCMKPEVLTELVEQGMLDVEALDRKCRHIIQTILAFEFDKRPQLDKSIPENNPYSDSVALEISKSAIVMLKNEDNFLPKKKGTFFVCGPNADKIVTGGGSGFVTPLISSSVAKAMTTMGGKVKADVLSDKVYDRLPAMYADKGMAVPGVSVEIYSNVNLEGEASGKYVAERVYLSGAPAEAHEDVIPEKLSSRHTFYYKPAADETYVIKLSGNDGCRIFINGTLVGSEWGNDSWQSVIEEYTFKGGVQHEVVVEHYNRGGTNGLDLMFESPVFATPQEEKQIKAADCVIVCLGHDNMTEKENKDRTFELPDGQIEYLREVLKLNKNVVVVLNAGGAVEMASWLPEVKAVLMAWYPGQQGGTAISEIITGKVSPSGKLPVSFEEKLEDNPCYVNYYENVPRMRAATINPYSRNEYREGIFVGYRGYEKNGVKPMFPFGFGLSYTIFEYSDLNIVKDGAEFVASFNVKNTGKVAGTEVAQVYVTDNECSVVRPEKELKGFEKVFLNPGETKTLSVRLGEEAFRFYSLGKHDFVVEPGVFTVSVGSSSADIRLTGTLSL